jgi:hypothetical protein
MKFGTVKDGRDYLDNIPLGAIMLCSQINNIILYIYIFCSDLCRIQHAHILAQRPNYYPKQAINLTVLLQKLQCMANEAALIQLGKSWKC